MQITLPVRFLVSQYILGHKNSNKIGLKRIFAYKLHRNALQVLKLSKITLHEWDFAAQYPETPSVTKTTIYDSKDC